MGPPAEAEDRPEEDVAHLAQVGISEFVLAKDVGQSAHEGPNATAGILDVQRYDTLECPLAVGDNRVLLRERLAEAVDGLSQNRRKVGRPIIIGRQRITEVEEHRPYGVFLWLHGIAQRFGVQRQAASYRRGWYTSRGCIVRATREPVCSGGRSDGSRGSR